MLFRGVVDLVPLFVGEFELYVGTGAANSGVAIQRTAAGLAVAPSAVREALRWRYGLMEGAQTPLWSRRQARCDKGLHWRPLGPITASRPGGSAKCTYCLVG